MFNFNIFKIVNGKIVILIFLLVPIK